MSDFQDKRTIKKCRKLCNCWWCRENINIGESAVDRYGVFGGDFFTQRYHPECNAALERYMDAYFKQYPHDDSCELPEEKQPRGRCLHDNYGKETHV